MNRYLRLFRFGNGVMGIAGVVVGALLASGTGILDHWFWIVATCVLVVIFMAGGNALNDYIDREIDKEGHPDRPLPMGEIKPETARNLGVAFLVVAFLISVPCAVLDVGGGWVTTVMVAVCTLLMFAYEVRLKNVGFVGNLTIAFLTAMIFMVGGSITGDHWGNAVFAAMAFLVNVGREVAKDIEDMEHDEGRRTLPMRVGTRNAALVSAVFFILGPILSIYPAAAGEVTWAYYIVILADVMFLYCAYMVTKDPHKAQSTAKYAMVVALVAFILDVIV